MRFLTVVVVWFLPCFLLCGGNEDYIRAKTLVSLALQELSPPADAVFDFTQTGRRLAHLSRPWQTYPLNVAGSFLLSDGTSSFGQVDSTTSGRGVYSSFKYYCDTTLAIIDYGETEPEKLTASDRRDFLYDVTVLTPVFLLKDFLAHDPETSFLRCVEGTVDSVVYKTNDGKIVSFAIDADENELRFASILFSQDLYGDVVRTMTFSEYTFSDSERFKYPSRIVEHVLGFDANVVTIGLSSRSFDKRRITSMIPSTYRIEADPPEPVEEIVRSDYNPHIHLLDLQHVNTRVLVVEFADYLLVSGAPLNTRNGEMIIREAQGIAPNKPVRYFVPGHHHPHYIGGIRAFVHHGATVLTAAPDSAYARQLTSFVRRLDPDSLQMEPRPLKLDIVDGEKIITDGEMEVRIIDIGRMSRHTENFLIFYFPKYKLLFQDELAWIPIDKPLTAAGERQRGLYEAIRLHDLDVETILQSWPLNRGVKSTFDFEELQRSVEMVPSEK